MLSLRHRLPLPPRLFVGRKAETKRLALALGRSGAVVVVGPEGVGKTALVTHALARARRADATYVTARAGDATVSILADVVEALSAGSRPTAGAFAGPDALLAAAVSLAEERRAWVVVDDAHHLDGAELGEVTETFARHAREARLVVVTRAAVGARSAEVVSLGAIADEDLTRLAAKLAPETPVEARARAVLAARGRPWTLARALEAIGVTATDMQADAEEARILRILTAARVPLPRALLDELAPAAAPATIATLVERGLVAETPEGDVHVAPAAAPLLDEPLERSVALGLAAKLADAAAPEHVLEGLRLVVEHDPAAAAGRITSHGPMLLDAGRAARLWPLLERVTVPSLLRMRCAHELGDPRALRTIEAPREESYEHHLAWARVLASRSELGEAAAAARRAARVARDPTDTFSATYQLLRYLVAAGRHAEARDAAEALVPDDDVGRARKELAAALMMLRLGDASGALARGEAAWAAWTGAVAPPALDVAWWWSCLLYETDRYPRAREVLDGALAEAAARDAWLQYSSDGRAVVHLRACIALMTGDLAATRRFAAVLGPSVSRGARWRFEAAILALHARLLEGDLEGLDAELAEAVADARATGNENLIEPLVALEARACLLRAAPLPPRPAGEGTTSEGWIASITHVARARAALRAGDEAHVASSEVPSRALLEAERSLLADRASDARARLVAVVAEATRGGDVDLLTEATATLADASLVAGDRGSACAAARQLGELAERLPSARFRAEAALLRVLAGEVLPGDPSRFVETTLLEALASPDRSPVAHRRARGLVDRSAPLDRVDRLVLAQAAIASERLDDRPFAPADAWIVDLERRTIDRRDERVDFTRRPIAWALLAALARGVSERAALFAAVWGDAVPYHPLDHGNRLQVAVHDLRKLVDDARVGASRIVTTDDGYGLRSALALRALPERGRVGAHPVPDRLG